VHVHVHMHVHARVLHHAVMERLTRWWRTAWRIALVERSGYGKERSGYHGAPSKERSGYHGAPSKERSGTPHVTAHALDHAANETNAYHDNTRGRCKFRSS
jgi:hypothetical protein